jgi:hypothetical protein
MFLVRASTAKAARICAPRRETGMSRYSLFAHQAAAEPLLSSGPAFLNWEMRTGKTRTILHAWDRLHGGAGGPKRLVIVCPHIARGVWKGELRAMGLGVPVLEVFGTENLRTRGQLVAGLPGIILVNWDILARWGEIITGWLDREPFVVVFDETHAHASNKMSRRPTIGLDAKNKTKVTPVMRYQAALALSRYAERTWCLTGTIYKKSALDVYNQLRLLGRGNPYWRTSAEEFAERFCDKIWNRFKGKAGGWEYKGLRAGAWDELAASIPCLSHIELRDCADIPAEQRIPYWLDEVDEDDKRSLVDLKVEATVDLCARFEEPLVIFGWHRDYVEKTAKALKAPWIDGDTSSLKRIEAIEGFTDGKHDRIVLNIRSGGMSIDLARAAITIHGEPYTAADHRQAEARIKGPRQRSDRIAHYYVLQAGSPDEDAWVRVLRNGHEMDSLDGAFRTAAQ